MTFGCKHSCMDIAISYWEEGGNPVKRELVQRLGEKYDVEVLDPEREHPTIADGEARLYHMAKRREESLRDLERAYRNGVRTLNTPEGAYTAVDRLETLRTLEEAGVPVPDYEYGNIEDVDIDTPVVSKPRTELGEDRHRVEFFGYISHPDIDTIGAEMDFVDKRLVQEYVDGRRHIKAYRLGDRVRAVEIDSTDIGHGTEIETDRELERLVHMAGDSIGLSFMEVDLVDGRGEYHAVDVNSTGNLGGVQEAVELYQGLIEEKLEG